MKALACGDSSTYTVNCWEQCPIVIGHTTDGSEMSIRPVVPYCGRGGELKDGMFVLIINIILLCTILYRG